MLKVRFLYLSNFDFVIIIVICLDSQRSLKNLHFGSPQCKILRQNNFMIIKLQHWKIAFESIFLSPPRFWPILSVKYKRTPPNHSKLDGVTRIFYCLHLNFCENWCHFYNKRDKINIAIYQKYFWHIFFWKYIKTFSGTYCKYHHF